MEYVRVRKTDLARNTSQIIRNVLRGKTTVIESHGQPEVAMIDIVDFNFNARLFIILVLHKNMRKISSLMKKP